MMRSSITPAPEELKSGQHMGLNVLVQLAKREGWGLSFSTDKPGFIALLEIPTGKG